MTQKKYRTRIYEKYQSAGKKSVSPITVADLAPRAAMFQKIIREHIDDNPAVRISDLGCGHGAFIYFLKKCGYQNVVGVDISEEQVAKAQILGVSEVVQGNIEEYLETLEPSSQDYIISFDIIEHFTKSELIDFVDQVFRALRPGGKWIIHTPNGTSPFFGSVYWGDYTHEQAFTLFSISQLLKASGFSSVNSYEDVPVPHGLKSSVRFILWKLVRLVLRFYFAIETGSGGKDLIFSQNFLTVAEK